MILLRKGDAELCKGDGVAVVTANISDVSPCGMVRSDHESIVVSWDFGGTPIIAQRVIVRSSAKRTASSCRFGYAYS